MYWGNSDYFQINTGVCWGFMISLFLFILGRRRGDLVFDDDITLLAATQRSLNKFSGTLECKAVKIRLQISASKSKILCVGYARVHTPILVGQQPLEEVNYFTYIGSIIDPDSSSDKDISCRIGKASAIMPWLLPIWRSVTIALQTKIRFLRSIVILMATYASETWNLSAMITTWLNVFQQRCLRRILKIYYHDRIAN